jgi:hypothetical protein
MIDGRQYLLFPLTLGDFGQLQAWCDARQPSPYASVSRQLGNGLFNRAQEQELLKSAIKLDTAPKPQLGSAECDELVCSLQGMAKLIQISIAKGDPRFTEEEALEVLKRMNPADVLLMKSILDVDFIVGGEKKGEDTDPKVESTGGPGTTPP